MRSALKLIAAGCLTLAGVNVDMTNPIHPVSEAQAQSLNCVYPTVSNAQVVIQNGCGAPIYWRACVTYSTGMKESFSGPGIDAGDTGEYAPPSAAYGSNFSAYVLSSTDPGQFLRCP
ncbi:MAG: hypothetical protein GC166_06645 [Alphaproteobacteria bacterium]|nr:hypothetical protein [Alphaproteobacteria bacterium]